MNASMHTRLWRVATERSLARLDAADPYSSVAVRWAARYPPYREVTHIQGKSAQKHDSGLSARV